MFVAAECGQDTPGIRFIRRLADNVPIEPSHRIGGENKALPYFWGNGRGF